MSIVKAIVRMYGSSKRIISAQGKAYNILYSGTFKNNLSGGVYDVSLAQKRFYSCNDATKKEYLICSDQKLSLSVQSKTGLVETLDLAACPPGSFEMWTNNPKAPKSSQPSIEVEISNPFLMSSAPITRGFYEALMGSLPATDELHTKSKNMPVTGLKYVDCIVFCNALSIHLGRKPCYTLPETITEKNSLAPDFNKSTGYYFDEATDGVRLPTEAEWEYAAKAGLECEYVGIPDSLGLAGKAKILKAISEFGVVDQNPYNISKAQRKTALADVKTKKENAWGFYDMVGNTQEWVMDFSSNGTKSDYTTLRDIKWESIKHIKDPLAWKSTYQAAVNVSHVCKNAFYDTAEIKELAIWSRSHKVDTAITRDSTVFNNTSFRIVIPLIITNFTKL